jgi:deazaflavin-dependent oxidoreductase (nitroreductase family)
VPLVALEDNETLILIASNFGQARHPAWYYNLRKHPEAAVTLRRQTKTYIAREATADERELYWTKAVEIYAGYAAYKTRARNRQIPIFVLTPKHK